MDKLEPPQLLGQLQRHPCRFLSWESRILVELDHGTRSLRGFFMEPPLKGYFFLWEGPLPEHPTTAAAVMATWVLGAYVHLRMFCHGLHTRQPLRGARPSKGSIFSPQPGKAAVLARAAFGHGNMKDQEAHETMKLQQSRGDIHRRVKKSWVKA